MARIVGQLSVAALEARCRAARDVTEARHLGLERVHPQRGWEALTRLGWSLQAPRPRHPRAATPERRAACKGGGLRRLLPRAQRDPEGRGAGPACPAARGARPARCGRWKPA